MSTGRYPRRPTPPSASSTVVIAAVLAAFLAAIVAGTPAHARTTAEACAAATAATERRAAVPAHLLTAISLAESGRWDATRRASVAWPWTVTARGEGQFFPTKAAAVAAVRKLARQGVRNIDVGCMQVNLMHHPKAFASLEEAFDPRANVAYGAAYLKSRHAARGSWSQAVADYHSRDPKRGRAYMRRVMALWTERQTPPERQRVDIPDPNAPPPAIRAAVDRVRTAALNARLKARRAAEQAVTEHGRLAPRRHRDPLAKLRSRRLETTGTPSPATVTGKRDAGSAEAFARKRREQLAAWRRSVAQ